MTQATAGRDSAVLTTGNHDFSLFAQEGSKKVVGKKITREQQAAINDGAEASQVLDDAQLHIVHDEQPEDEQIANLEAHMSEDAGEEKAPETDLEKMIAARKALDDQIKAAKAVAKPKKSNLEMVRARQSTAPAWLGTWVSARV